MSLRRCDRYLLRQMLGPFFLALAGLSLFILLNLILQLSDLIADRGVGIVQLLRLLIFWMPELMTWAIPMSALFAVFLGLGRMEHDREIMALESIGVSLRRVLLPLLIASIGVSFLTFAVYNWAMPASKNAAQRAYREILFAQSVPRISANTFFTGSEGLYFHVRQYDADDGSMRDVYVTDVSGQLFPQAESRITIVTADTGTWTGEDWELAAGHVYGFNRENVLVYSATFEELIIPVAQTADQLWAQSKSPSEMGIREIVALIRRARTSGLPINESIFELHQRFALPFSALLFVLVGGVVSLMFGSKNRSTGIIIGLLIIGLYQGTHFWMQTLGRRGAMNPAVAAWIPNLLFGLIGLLLFLRVDKLASRDMWNRLRSRLPFLTSLLCLVVFSLTSTGQDVPLHLECDDLFISTDRTEVIAQGSVRAKLDDADLQADSLYLKQDNDGQWRLEVAGSVSLDFGEFDLTGDRVAADILISETGTRPQSLEATGFHGQSDFTNSSGEEQTLYFQGESGQLVFDESGGLNLVEIRNGEVTTCNCCDRPFQSQPYTLRANRLLFYPDQLIVAFGLAGRIGGASVLWLPVYVQPLEDTLESPLFPAFGTNTLRGWFLKWNVPFYLSESLYGSVLFDYYSKHSELGLGLITRYAFAGHEGQMRMYSFPAKVGDSIVEFSANHTLPSSGVWRGQGNLEYRAVGETTDLEYGAQAEATSEGWTMRISAARESLEENVDDDDEDNDRTRVTDRFPELAMSREPWNIALLSIHPSLSIGRYRERINEEPAIEALRMSGSLGLGTEPQTFLGVSLKPSLNLRVTAYKGDSLQQTIGSLQAAVTAHWHDVSANYSLVLVQGDSPFDFDTEVATHHIGLSFTREGWATLNLSGGFDLSELTLDPIRADLSWTLWADWSLQAHYALMDAALESIELSGNWRSDVLQLSLTVPYQPSESRFGTITLSADMPGEWLNVDSKLKLQNGELTVRTNFESTLSLGPLDLSGTVKFRNLSLSGLELTGTFVSELGWGAKARWDYSGGPISLDQLRYGAFWDVGGCLRVGIDREAADTWFYVSILAFPEAILRYAPESASIQLGD